MLKMQTQISAQVGADDEVMLIESMKMEIPVLAEAAGTVRDILVDEGGAVKEGQALLLLA